MDGDDWYELTRSTSNNTSKLLSKEEETIAKLKDHCLKSKEKNEIEFLLSKVNFLHELMSFEIVFRYQ